MRKIHSRPVKDEYVGPIEGSTLREEVTEEKGDSRGTAGVEGREGSKRHWCVLKGILVA